MTYEFIGESKPSLIQHSVFCEHDCVIERTTANQIRPPQSFNLFNEPKRARRSNIARERPIIQSHVAMLHTDKGMRKVDRAIDFVNVRWFDRDAAIAGRS